MPPKKSIDTTPLALNPPTAGPSTDAPIHLASAVDFGEVTLAGEIVDSKCYLGVMNPGNGKVHRDLGDYTMCPNVVSSIALDEGPRGRDSK